MSVVKVIEVLSESNKGWEDAAQKAVAEASKTLSNVRSVWVKNLNAEVRKGKIVTWRLNCKISFELNGKQ
jgi:flavin-binding protein dodecin